MAESRENWRIFLRHTITMLRMEFCLHGLIGELIAVFVCMI